MGASKVIPSGTFRKGTISIPRAELCAAYMLAKAALQAEADLKRNLDLSKTIFFTDSIDVLKWIENTKDTFPKYVTSRRNYILTVSDIDQWKSIPGEFNPSDVGTRPIDLERLKSSDMINGPSFLHRQPYIIPATNKTSNRNESENLKTKIADEDD